MIEKIKILHMIVTLIFMIITILFVTSNISVPKDLLNIQGYEINEEIEFTYIKENWWERGIYRSSEPITLHDGTKCEYWQVRSSGRSVFRNYVEPIQVESE